VAVRRFSSTPKGLLIIGLAVLVLLSAQPREGLSIVAPGLAAAILVAGVIDAVILRKKNGAWVFPDGAVLTGLFIAMLLSPHQPSHVAAVASAVAVLSKYIFRSRWANVFNPAALALIAVFYIFAATQNWWGAMAELPPVGLIPLFVIGVFIADRVNKMPMVVAFLAAYYFVFTVTAFLGNPQRVAEIFRAPDLHASLFFAFFILTDPPTSPVRYNDQVTYSLIVALSAYLFFEVIGAVYYLLAGVLVGNVWEAWRRWYSFSRRKSAISR
jgi:enediyne biosynthesis protein E5